MHADSYPIAQTFVNEFQRCKYCVSASLFLFLISPVDLRLADSSDRPLLGVSLHKYMEVTLSSKHGYWLYGCQSIKRERHLKTEDKDG